MASDSTAQEVLAILESGSYVANGEVVFIEDIQKSAVNSSQLYSPSELDSLREDPDDGLPGRLEVVDGTTQVIAFEMVSKSSKPVALLNFASARNPGGGFLNGAKAQEEDLCRCSGLYPCLLRCPQYYDENRLQESLLYTDYAIFSCDVPFFRIRSTGDFLRTPYVASVITAPAPNSRPFLKHHPEQTDLLADTFLRRWENVLCIARDRGIGRLLLGAWGCGAFGGDPYMAAKTAHKAIHRFGAAFDEVVFAIPGQGKQSKANLDAFKLVFQ